MDRSFQEVYPSSQKDVYTQNDNINMLCKIPQGTELVKNSIKIQGTLKFRRNGNVIGVNVNTWQLYYAHESGIHNFFNNWVTSFPKVGITEHLNHYGRYVKMIEQVNSNDEERLCTSKKNLELKTASDKDTVISLAGQAGSTYFSFKPVIAINRSNRNITSNDFDEFKVSFVLQDVYKACFGADCVPANNITYTIEELKMTYFTQPISKESTGPLIMKTVSVMTHAIDSRLANFDITLPIDTMNLATTVALQTTIANNNQAIEYLDIQNLKYTFNNSNRSLIAFNLDNYQEIMYQYMRTLKELQEDDGIDSLNPAYKTTDFGFGINLEQYQKAGNKIGIEIKNNSADAGAGKIYMMFTYAQGLIQL
jgi:hypothetical protein